MIKKQSSFLIENKPRRNNKSFIDFTMDDGDNKSENASEVNVRTLKHQNSSSALISRGGKLNMGGAFGGLARQGSTNDQLGKLPAGTSQFKPPIQKQASED
jgi:hypothetical protein